LLSHLKVAKADWFGYGSGGHIALQVAISYPEVVHGLILQSIMCKR
jgi:pimeloyl-ACP methyl ester carboxylesterase